MLCALSAPYWALVCRCVCARTWAILVAVTLMLCALSAPYWALVCRCACAHTWAILIAVTLMLCALCSQLGHAIETEDFATIQQMMRMINR